MCVFPVVAAGAETLKYIFPSKQKAAQQAIALANLDERIHRLVIFGSAITMQCGMGSDLDIAVDAPDVSEDEFLKMTRNFYLGVDSEIDMIHYNTIHNSLLRKEIDEKGINVYVKRQ